MRFRRLCSVVVMVAGVVTVGAAAPLSVESVQAASCEASALPGAPVAAAAAHASGFHALTPTRLLDTRESGAPVRAGCIVALDVSANASIPDDAQALALNITTVDAAARGFVTVYPCGTTRPNTSNVNSRAVDATANSVLVELDATRVICMYTQTSLHLIVDVTGWFGRFGMPYHALDSTRLLDTRTALRPDGGTGVLAKGVSLPIPVAGEAIPAEAKAVAINVTVTDAIGSGFVTVYPCSGQRPPTSTVNYLAAEQRANHVVVGLDGDGALCVWTSEAVHVIIDLEGWFGGVPGTGTMFRPLVGSRVLDTRIGTGGVSGIVAANTTVSFDPADKARLPLGSTVALNVVSTESASSGYITLYACNAGQPNTSAVNAVVGTEATNVAFVPVESDGRVCLFASVDMQIVIDVIGTFGAGGSLHELTIDRPFGQVFSPDAHDYTVRCNAGINAMTVHAVGAPGTLVSITPSTAPAPAPTARDIGASLTLHEDEAFVVRAGVPGAAPEEYWVRCLPHDFPVLQVTRTELPNPGWYLADAAFPAPTPDPSRFLMILDNRSVPVWYHRVASPSIDLKLMSNGNLAWTKLLGLAFGSDPAGVFEIHRLDGTLVRSIATVSGPTDHHDIAELPNGNVVLATYVPRLHVDLRILGAGYTNDELVYDNHLEEIRPDGTVAWTWKSEDHIPISASTFPQRFPGIAGVGVDLVHVNSIHIAPDGDVIMSGRHTDAVYKIRRNTAGDVVWRIGGNQSDVTFVNDPLGGFGRQHDAQLLPSGNLRLFDNRTSLSGSPRAAEYAIDLVKHTATLVWSVSDPLVGSSGGVGSVRDIGDGDTVITWGGSTSPAFTEVAADGTKLQSTTMVGHYAYRVDKQPLDAFDISVLRATAGH
jgi:Arylsulfotransferase (ASST)